MRRIGPRRRAAGHEAKAAAGNRRGAADVCLWSDARSALQSINQALAARPQDAPARTGWRTEIGGAAKFRAEIDNGLDAKARAQSSALRAIKSALPWDGVVFSDMTQIAYLGNYAYPVDNPGQWFHPSGYVYDNCP